jgi:phosphatidylserine decarboxylase
MRIPIARAATPFVTVLVVLAVALAAWEPWASALPVTLLGFVLWFFRDPERAIDVPSGVALSPADGRIIKLDERERRVSIFLNLFDVHVCRAPVAARIESLVHTPGRFLAAFKDAASHHNERTTLELAVPGGRMIVVLVAGLVARRIVTWVACGQHVDRGQRVGLIRFGSRVDVEVPRGYRLTVRLGERVRAGITEIARRDDPVANTGETRSPGGGDV